MLPDLSYHLKDYAEYGRLKLEPIKKGMESQWPPIIRVIIKYMNKISKFVLKTKNPYLWKLYSYIGYILLIPPRAKMASSYLSPPIRLAFKWLFESRETSNFSYSLTNRNNLYLAHSIGAVTGQSVEKIKGYINEIENNENLKKHIANYIKEGPNNFTLGPLIAYGRRVGWYAVVRAVKPKVVVETGAAQGLGSCIIVEALKKNLEEGAKGKYFGTDIMPDAGALLIGDYKKYGEILYGDSIKSLKKLKNKIDVFINDSDHSSKYEKKEYQTIEKLLRENSVILGDNSHESEELCKFAEKTNRNFIFFKEQPKNHWYPGAGIGIAYRKKSK